MSNIDAFYSIALHHAAARARTSGFGKNLQERHFAKNDIFIGPRGGTYKIVNGHKSYFGARLSKRSRRASQLRTKMSKLYKSAKKRSRSRSPRRRSRRRSRSPRRRRKQKGKMKVKGRVIITRPRRRSPRRSKRRPRSGPNKCRWQTEIRCRGPKAPRLCS